MSRFFAPGSRFINPATGEFGAIAGNAHWFYQDDADLKKDTIVTLSDLSLLTRNHDIETTIGDLASNWVKAVPVYPTKGDIVLVVGNTDKSASVVLDVGEEVEVEDVLTPPSESGKNTHFYDLSEVAVVLPALDDKPAEKYRSGETAVVVWLFSGMGPMKGDPTFGEEGVVTDQREGIDDLKDTDIVVTIAGHRWGVDRSFLRARYDAFAQVVSDAETTISDLDFGDVEKRIIAHFLDAFGGYLDSAADEHRHQQQEAGGKASPTGRTTHLEPEMQYAQGVSYADATSDGKDYEDDASLDAAYDEFIGDLVACLDAADNDTRILGEQIAERSKTISDVLNAIMPLLWRTRTTEYLKLSLDEVDAVCEAILKISNVNTDIGRLQGNTDMIRDAIGCVKDDVADVLQTPADAAPTSEALKRKRKENLDKGLNDLLDLFL